MVSAERYAFGDFVLERSQQRVRHRDGTPINLTPRLFSALLLFVERAGDLLDKDTLILALWPGLVVEENNLSQVISSLRRALGDDTQGSHYIQTVPRRGFRFIAVVTVLPDHALTGTMPREAAPATPLPELLPMQPGALAANAAGNIAGVGGTASAKRHWLRAAVAGIVASGLGGAWWWILRRTAGNGASTTRATLAVLPFKPLVVESRDELLEVGMADSLIARLSIMPGLVVRSVGSVRRYVGPDQDPLRAARDLDVAWIVDGSLQRRGEQVRVTVRLLSTANGVTVWSGSFNEKFSGIFDTQDAISARVARVLAAKLDTVTVGSASLKSVGGTRSADAYQLYLTARQYAQDSRAAGLTKSVKFYNKALDVDPGYALAYAGLAETYRRMPFGADTAPIEAFEPAKIAAQRALALAPELAEAHAGLGWIRFWYDFDWPAAEQVFRHALMLNANSADAHFGLGLMLLSLDRPDEGFSHLRFARELDPMSRILNTLEASFLLGRGQRDEAAARLARAFEIDPDFWVAHLTLGALQLTDKQPEKAIETFRHAETLADGSTQPTVILGVQLARAGKRDAAREVLQRLLALQKIRYVPPTSVAAVHAALGEIIPALDALERAISVRDTRLVYMKDDGRWRGLRDQPRFIALLQRMKLDGYAQARPAK